MDKKLLEVCVDSIASGVEAHRAGAGRIELCGALSEGGLTPPLGTFVQLKKLIDTERTKIFVMLRPRRGADFNYSEDEMESINFDLRIFKSHGADGFVFGALSSTTEIDVPNCRRVLEAAVDLPVTFHRAFDCLTGDPERHLEIITELGFKRLLTSGRESNAQLGLQKLAEWNEKFGKDLVIMPGAGINSNNLTEIVTKSGCREFHSSCRAGGPIEKNAILQDLDSPVLTDALKVQSLVDILNSSSV